MKISFIGSGNVTHVLARLVHRSAHKIEQVICRHPGDVDELASTLQIPSVIGFDRQVAAADIYIVAISDDALPLLHKKFRVSQGIVVHTAGAVPENVLENCGPATGVLYPFQSLRKELSQIPEIPFLIHSANPQAQNDLYAFALDISSMVRICNDEEREKYHLSAVMSSNFINHLLALSFDYCRSENVDTDWLLPVIMETVTRVGNKDPSNLQTGPAIRNDRLTLNRHEEMLFNYPSLRALYSVMSASISDYYKEKKSDKSG